MTGVENSSPGTPADRTTRLIGVILAVGAGLTAPAALAQAQPAAAADACWDLVEPAGFADISELDGESVAAIDCAAHYGITHGTSQDAYSPGRTVSRSQTTLFLARTVTALELPLPSGPPQPFTDLDGLDADTRRAAALLHELGIAKGRGAGTFEPRKDVTRQQMALFLSRLLRRAGVRLPAPGSIGFDDLGGVPPEAAEAIGRLAAAGIVTAASAGRFDPSGEVTREGMALMLARSLEAAGARPARLELGLSSLDVIVGGATEGTVRAMKPNGEPYRGLQIDIFAAVGLTASGACRLDPGARVNGGDAGTSHNCRIDRGDPRSDASGVVRFGLAHSQESAYNRVHAWAGARGDVFDADDVMVRAETAIVWKPPPTGVAVNAPQQAVFGRKVVVRVRLTGPGADGKRMVLILGTADGTAREVLTETTGGDGRAEFSLPGRADPSDGREPEVTQVERLLVFWDRNGNSVHDGPAELSAVSEIAWRQP